jgi:hypothetical protein
LNYVIIGLLIGIGLFLAPVVLGAGVKLVYLLDFFMLSQIDSAAARKARREKADREVYRRETAVNPYARAEADIRKRGLNTSRQ